MQTELVVQQMRLQKLHSGNIGGGHANAGTCQVVNEMAVDVLAALFRRINREG
jgi:nanoRNase/pAp phosphatase (c-di-AMP/oligoRNAs hydrolase)